MAFKDICRSINIEIGEHILNFPKCQECKISLNYDWLRENYVMLIQNNIYASLIDVLNFELFVINWSECNGNLRCIHLFNLIMLDTNFGSSKAYF